jgi:N4-gp56 family major capsid protein
MPVNSSPAFQADIEGYIADKTLPLARRQLVAFQFADKSEGIPKGRGVTYVATRYLRLPLPSAPLSEGVPPIGESMSIQQVTATALQWGDKVTITDVTEMTIKHPLFQKANELVALQLSETLERNTFNELMAGTQVNYVNSRGARASLVAGDVLDAATVSRTDAALETLGAPRWMGDEMTDTKIEAGKPTKASSNPTSMPHYVALIHTNVVYDFRTNPTVVQAWTYSDLNRLYNYEAGEWSGIRFCKTNMIPYFTQVANTGQNATAGTAGALATNATYYVIITGSDTQNQYEQLIYAISAAVNVTGPNGSIAVTLPSTVGYTYSAYIGTTTTPQNLALSASGPTSGPLAGVATQMAGGATVILTAVGPMQVPPAAPGAGLTVYPTFILGRGAYASVELDSAKFTYLKDADKSDPLNQLRIVGWKCFYGMLLSNVQFMARIESVSALVGSTFG